MMSKNINQYKSAMDNIRMSESFAKRTETLLKEIPENKEAVPVGSSRISLGMYITDFLQLECSFEGHRITVSTTEEEEIAGVCKRAAEVGYAVVELQHFLHLRRNVI